MISLFCVLCVRFLRFFMLSLPVPLYLLLKHTIYIISKMYTKQQTDANITPHTNTRRTHAEWTAAALSPCIMDNKNTNTHVHSRTAHTKTCSSNSASPQTPNRYLCTSKAATKYKHTHKVVVTKLNVPSISPTTQPPTTENKAL